MSLFDLFRKEKQPQKPAVFPQVKVPYDILPGNCSAEALMTLWKNANRTRGVPVLLKLEDTLLEVLEEEGRYEDGPLPDLDQFLAPAIQELYSDEESAFLLGEPGDVGGSIEQFLSFQFGSGEPVVMAFVPAEEPWDIFRHLPVGGWNDCPAPNVFAAFCQAMYRAFGAVPAVLTGDTMEMIPARRPTHEEAFPLALKMYGFCPDIVTQGVGTVQALADTLEKSDVWYFWWD